jgi:hypothetical protein
MDCVASIDHQEWLLCSQATRKLGRSRSFVDRLARIGKIRTTIGGCGRVFFNREDIESLARTPRHAGQVEPEAVSA